MSPTLEPLGQNFPWFFYLLDIGMPSSLHMEAIQVRFDQILRSYVTQKKKKKYIYIYSMMFNITTYM